MNENHGNFNFFQSREKLISTPRGSDAGLSSEGEDARTALQDVEQNIANIERNLSLQERMTSVVKSKKTKEKSPDPSKKR